jgi:hypothetical protein
MRNSRPAQGTARTTRNYLVVINHSNAVYYNQFRTVVKMPMALGVVGGNPTDRGQKEPGDCARWGKHPRCQATHRCPGGIVVERFDGEFGKAILCLGVSYLSD